MIAAMDKPTVAKIKIFAVPGSKTISEKSSVIKEIVHCPSASWIQRAMA